MESKLETIAYEITSDNHIYRIPLTGNVPGKPQEFYRNKNERN